LHGARDHLKPVIARRRQHTLVTAAGDNRQNGNLREPACSRAN
jgi:hypothetical protein